MKSFWFSGLILILLSFAGCVSSTGNDGQLQSFAFNAVEPQWIRDGEPIEYNGQKWYPADGTENFLDSEIPALMEFRGTQVFIDKMDVKPYNRLYTKFSKNQFRYFLPKKNE